MKIHIIIFAAILLIASCSTQNSADGNSEACIGDTIFSSDSLVSIHHLTKNDNTDKTKVMCHVKSSSHEEDEVTVAELEGCRVTQVSTFYSNLGLSLCYYLFNSYKQEGDLFISEVRAYNVHSVSRCSFDPMALFPNRQSCISSKPYNHNKWEIRCGKHTNKSLIHISDEEECVYMPEVGSDSVPTDRYIVYQFDGYLFDIVAENAPNPLLHNSLADYVRLRRQDETYALIQRVDEMTNGQLRLAIWAKGRKGRKVRSICEEPDLVVYGGKEIDKDVYEFEHRGTRFKINLEDMIEKKND